METNIDITNTDDPERKIWTLRVYNQKIIVSY